MSERKYSVAEIDRMREMISWSFPDGVSYKQHERSAEIENRVRTYMQNGTDPEELEAEISRYLGAMPGTEPWNVGEQ